MDDDAVEIAARAAFDATPHRHPRGLVPDWTMQPEHLKDIFRDRIRGNARKIEPWPPRPLSATS